MRLFLLMLLILLSSCSPERKKNTLTITSWNAYCFFDGSDDGTEFTEFTSAGGYDREKYLERIEAASRYMALNMGESDMIILEEIESADVLKDLLEENLRALGFMYYGLAQKSEGSLSVGFISKFRPEAFNFHSFASSSRVIAEIRFSVCGETVTLLGVHLRSRLNDDTVRIGELSLIKTLIERKKDEAVIVMGDFNTDCVRDGEIGDRRQTGDAVIYLTGDGSASYNGVLFSPYLDYGKPLDEGSYYHDGVWYNYDNALLTSAFFDGNGVEYDGFSIVKGADAVTSAGTPLKYDKSTSTGYSDHFAIMLRLKYN